MGAGNLAGEARAAWPIGNRHVRFKTSAWHPGKTHHGKVVLTWNYVAVHAHGTTRVMDDPHWMLEGKLKASQDEDLQDRRGTVQGLQPNHNNDQSREMAGLVLSALISNETSG